MPEISTWELNEADSYAIETAVRMCESRSDDSEVVVVTAGPEGAEAILRKCLAAGANRAIRVPVEIDDPLATAAALAAVIGTEAPELTICGVQSSDAGNAATASALAGYVDQPIATAVVALEIDAERGIALAVRVLEGGIRERVEIDLPAVITVQTGIFPTRKPNLKAVKKSRSAPIESADTSPPPSNIAQQISAYLPGRNRQAEMLGSDPKAIASTIIQLIKESAP